MEGPEDGALMWGIPDIAMRLGEHVHTVAHWYWEGHPFDALPTPDMVCDGEPYWMRNRLRSWLGRQQKIAQNTGNPTIPPEIMLILRTGMGQVKEMAELKNKVKANFNELMQDAQEMDIPGLAEDFPLMARIAIDLDMRPDRLVSTADRLALAGMWPALSFDDDIIQSETPVGMFCRGLRGVALRHCGAIEESMAELAAVLRSPILPRDAKEFLEYQRAHSGIFAGMLGFAREEFKMILAKGGLYAGQAQFSLAMLDSYQGRFRDVLERAPEDTLAHHWQRVVGDVHKSNANFEQARASFEGAVQDAERLGEPGLAARQRAHLAASVAWSSPQEAVAMARDAIAENQKFDNQLEELISYIALGLASIGTAPPEQAEAALQEGERIVQATGAIWAEPQLLATRAFQAAFAGRNDDLSRLTNMVRNRSNAYGAEGYYVDILPTWSGGSTLRSVDRARSWQWLDDAEQSLHRWHEILEARHAIAAS